MKAICSEYRIHNADIHVRGDCDVDDLVDVIEGSRVYIPAIYVINKIDQVGSKLLSHCALPQGGSCVDWSLCTTIGRFSVPHGHCAHPGNAQPSGSAPGYQRIYLRNDYFYSLSEAAALEGCLCGHNHQKQARSSFTPRVLTHDHMARSLDIAARTKSPSVGSRPPFFKNILEEKRGPTYYVQETLEPAQVGVGKNYRGDVRLHGIYM